MEHSLFVTNPTMSGVLDLWYKSFGYVCHHTAYVLYMLLISYYYYYNYLLFYPVCYYIVYTVASNLRLVNVEDIKHRPEALELAVFQNVVMKHIEMARETLMKK